jgi:hypothetical protein
MRVVGLAILLAGCSPSADDAEGGSLTCKDGHRAGDRTYVVDVAPGQLSTVRDHAEDVAKLMDCRFVAGVRKRTQVARIIPRPIPRDRFVAPPTPPLPDDADLMGGVVGGSIDIDLIAPPTNVPPTLLETHRISGNKQIVPDADTQLEILRSGKDKVVGSYKMCLTVDGTVSVVSQLKSTGFSAYDGRIIGEMKTWKYRPYEVNGRAAPVCTAVTFIYSP